MKTAVIMCTQTQAVLQTHKVNATLLDWHKSFETSADKQHKTVWSRNLTNINVPKFEALIGPTTIIPSSPLDIFQLFFSNELLEDVVNTTNRYARETMKTEQQYDKWTKVTPDEIKAFFGFHLLMSINRLPSIDDYWSKNPNLHYTPIASKISQDRFRDISQYLHFVDNANVVPRGHPMHDRLGKVRPILEAIVQKCLHLYNPHREVTVDEAMIKFQGRSSLKQYLPLKPIKRGIKVWVLADAHNGYFCNLSVYCGKDGKSGEKGLASNVVKQLTGHIKEKSHVVFFDNFFTSVQLIEDLLKDRILACGTARQNRKQFPEELSKSKLKIRLAI